MWDDYVDFRDMPPFAFDLELEAPLQTALNRGASGSLDIAA
jgi:hypothetical protein